jgi:transcriptional repressor NrdR
VRCPLCAGVDDKVVDSRLAEDGSAIRRRRECLGCGRRFTTFERIDELPLVVVKRSGEREQFDRTKVVEGLRAACKNRPVLEETLETLASEVEEAARLEGAEVTTELVGLEVLERLRLVDEVAYVRFASVYREFDDPADFSREVARLRKKADADQPPALG